jgi:hypothetical protein
MRKVIASLALALLALPAVACECMQYEPTESSIARASRIFVFQVAATAADVSPDGAIHPWLGKVSFRVADQIVGGGPSVGTASFSFSDCCGSRFEVGHYYLAFLELEDSQPQFTPANVIYYGTFYHEGSEVALESIIASVQEGATFREAFSRFDLYRAVTEPQPPSPPCIAVETPEYAAQLCVQADCGDTP